jgi:hypothetical protein
MAHWLLNHKNNGISILIKAVVTKTRLVTASNILQNLQKYEFSSLNGNEDSKLLNNLKAGVSYLVSNEMIGKL